MKVAIVGSREFNDYPNLFRTMQALRMAYGFDEIVSGGANGADKMAERYADEIGLSIHVFHPDWEKHGRSAGFIRNRTIVENSDMVVAFWDGKSAGTGHSIDLARAAKKPTLTIYF